VFEVGSCSLDTRVQLFPIVLGFCLTGGLLLGFTGAVDTCTQLEVESLGGRGDARTPEGGRGGVGFSLMLTLFVQLFGSVLVRFESIGGGGVRI